MLAKLHSAKLAPGILVWLIGFIANRFDQTAPAIMT
jgi:hypothetical protein